MSKLRLILASASPQRRTILTDAGIPFESIDPGEVEESITKAATPSALAIAKAQIKAESVAARLAPPFPAIVVGVDTLVALGDEIIGKPRDRADAIAILSRLNASRHCCISGMCLTPTGPETAALTRRLSSAATWITMRTMSLRQIEEYVDAGHSDGKAGAYAIQENDRFIAELDGCFLNVVGFPLELFRDELDAARKQWGF